jgi:hypothetical protein
MHYEGLHETNEHPGYGLNSAEAYRLNSGAVAGTTFSKYLKLFVVRQQTRRELLSAVDISVDSTVGYGVFGWFIATECPNSSRLPVVGVRASSLPSVIGLLIAA